MFLLLRVLIFRRSFTRASLLKFSLLSAPAWAIEFFFERNSRPTFSPDGEGLKRAGEDLEAKGLTEWMWDILYWTWGCVVTVALLGDWAWWAYLAVPFYSVWLAWSTFGSVRQSLGMGGASQAQENGESKAAGPSKRQAKLEKRGGQRMQYR